MPVTGLVLLRAAGPKLRCDLELLRLAYVLREFLTAMLWYRLAALAPSGQLALADLPQRLGMNRATFYRRLNLAQVMAGESAWFRASSDGRLYLRGWAAAAAIVTARVAGAGHARALELGRPGTGRVYLPRHLRPEQAYAAWLALRFNDRPLSRAAQAAAWNVRTKTTRKWCIEAGIKVLPQFARAEVTPEELAESPYLPAGREDFHYRDGEARWQRPNRYESPAQPRRAARGQGRKVRAAVNEAHPPQPAAMLPDGHPWHVRNITGPELARFSPTHKRYRDAAILYLAAPVTGIWQPLLVTPRRPEIRI